jgi:signal transduction histidine kinase
VSPILRVLSPLWSPLTYTRWVYLVLGGAVALPYLLAGAVLATLVLGDGEAVSPDASLPLTLVAAPVAVLLIGATAWVPGARTLEGHLTRTLLGGPIAGEPVAEAATARSRARTGVWLLLHLLVGFLACLATMVGLTESAGLALAALTGEASSSTGGLLHLTGTGALDVPRRLLAPFNGLAVLLALIALMGLCGAGLARLAPLLLGPSAAERLAAAQDRAENLAERNRLARELHDSIGHALSVVALQAGAAARVIDTDPAFARAALEAIAAQARTATGELDHVLGLLREERNGATGPQRSLGDLDHLLDATRAIGADLDARVSGDVAAVPGVVSRETYRICQEGLTNALRHGGRVPIALRLDVGADRLEVEITNPSGPARRRASGGRGLRGMRERVRLLGGTLDAGTADGRWRLHATISWPPA